MDDSEIVALFFARSEAAIAETTKKYGKYCHSIAFHILHNDEDAEECVNDTYLNAWNSIPPHRPSCLRTFLGRLVRNLSLNKYKQLTAKKRGEGQLPMIIEELYECIPANNLTENIPETLVLTDVFNRFLGSLPETQRRIFMRRYWYFGSIKEIAKEYSMSEGSVKMSLLRARNGLKELLQKEGISL